MERFNSFSSDQIVLTKRQASMIMASMLLFCLFVFIVGFFLGKRTTIDDFSSKVTKEALHDQIDFLLTTQSLQSSQQEEGSVAVDSDLSSGADTFFAPSVIEEQAVVTVEPAKDTAVISSDVKDVKNDTQDRVPVVTRESTVQKTEENEAKEQTVSVGDKKPQYAQLIGFGTKKAAEIFVARLKKHNVPVILKTMMSKTAAGKQRVWYQAITPTYETSQELQAQLTKIKRLEHIRDKDMKIIYVK